MKYLHKAFLVETYESINHSDTTLSVEDPRLIKDQSVQNVIAHWAPKFIIDAMYDLVTDENENKLGESKIHTLTTYKQPDSVIAPTIARQLESY